MELGRSRSPMFVATLARIFLVASIVLIERYSRRSSAQDLAFLVSSKPSFTIPLNLLSNTVLASKTEVVLDLNPNTASTHVMTKEEEAEEDNVTRKKRLRNLPDQVVEMRFFIPGSAKSKGLKKKEGKKVKAKKEEGADEDMKAASDNDEEDDDDDDDDQGESAAQAFFEALKERSDMGQEVGESLGVISDVLCMTPRGRFGSSFHFSFDSFYLNLIVFSYVGSIRYRIIPRISSTQRKDLRL